jgi:hypothetical protein
VLDALRDMQRLTREVGEAMATRLPRGDSLVDAFAFAWSDMREDIMEAERRLVIAMRHDVGPGRGTARGQTDSLPRFAWRSARAGLRRQRHVTGRR